MAYFDFTEHTTALKINNMKILNNFLCLFIIVLFIGACGNKSKDVQDTTTSGKITITADESLFPIIEAQREAFEYIYPKAKINIIYTNETDAMQLVCSDSARMAIVTRELNAEEKALFEAVKIKPRYTDIAYDAIAVVVNNSNPKSVFTKEQLGAILRGEIKQWNQLDKSLPAQSIQVVFDSPKSGAIRLLKDSVMNGKELGDNCFAVKSNPEVIKYVSENRNAIGLIGVAWISDQDDSSSVNFTQQIKVCELVPEHPEIAEAPSMKPYQAYIALKQYPLWRKVIIVSRETRMGLGTGFASYIASDKGQRIILKSGLVPALAPIRLVEINNQPLNIQ
jgi:phosphate transport system substrate-binding protein